MMKKVTMEYRDEWTEISVPDSAEVVQYGTPAFREMPIHSNPEKAVRDALENPVAMDRLSNLVSKGQKITIAFDDPVKNPESIKTVIPLVIEELAKANVSEKDITLICATGAHAMLRPSELRAHLGPRLYDRFCPFHGSSTRILNHDCTQDTVYLGETDLGDQLEYNQVLKSADQVIYVGTIFAFPYGGYGGQGVVIGLAGKRALDSHHSFEVFRTAESLHADFRPEKNKFRKHKLAMHEKIEDAIGKKIFYVDAIQGPQRKILQVFSGHVPELEQKEYPEADKYFKIKTHQFDIVVRGIPYHLDYGDSDNPSVMCNEAQRPLRMWQNKPLLKENGVLIAMTRCTGALNDKKRPGDVQALRILRECFDLRELYDHTEEFWNDPELLHKYRHEYAYAPIHALFEAANICTLWSLARNTILVGEINPGLVREIGLIPAKNFDEALRISTQIVGRDPEMLVLPRYFHDPAPIFDVA